MNIIIVEDDRLIANEISRKLSQLGYTKHKIARDHKQATKLLGQYPFDFALLDINLSSEPDGIALAQYIRENHELPIVFLSSYSDIATVEKAAAVKPNGYIRKPFDKNDLFTGIKIGIANFNAWKAQFSSVNEIQRSTLQHAFIKDGGAFVKVQKADILFLKSDRNYVELHLADKRYILRTSLTELCEMLNDQSLIKIHKSYVINIDQIDQISPTSVTIKEHDLPVSRGLKDDLMKHLQLVS